MNWTQQFRDFSETSGVTCIEVYAPNCGPCRVQKKVTEQLCEQFEPAITFARIDGSKREDLMTRWNVRAVPQFLIFVNDQIHTRFLGPESYESIASKISEIRGQKSKTD